MATEIVELCAFPGYGVDRRGGTWTRRPKNGIGNLDSEWRRLKQKKTKYGYMTVVLLADGIRHDKRVHRLVLEAFIGPALDGLFACHENGVRDDNRIENLRWDTPAANQLDRNRHGTGQRGERHFKAKLKWDDIPKIREMRQAGMCIKSIAKTFGVTECPIRNVLSGKAWKPEA